MSFIKTFLVVFLLLATSAALAQVQEEWVARYNGPGNLGDYAYALAVDADGNVYVTGGGYGSGTSIDYATIKYDTGGGTVWVARYNGPVNEGDVARALALDGSGNVYVTGQSMGSGTYFDYATIKYGSGGGTIWVARYNGPGNVTDRANAVAVDASGNVYVTGYSGSYYDYATIKYDSDGNELWVRRYNGPGDGADEASALAVDGSGNVYVTGYSTGSDRSCDYATIKYDPNGDTLWVRRYSGLPGYGDLANALAVDDSGNVYVTGYSYVSDTNYEDYATIKYDPNGDTVWVRHYNGAGSSSDWANALAVGGSGNVYVTGQSFSGTSWDYATVKYDSGGNQLWVARYNDPADSHDVATALALDASGNVYVTGADNMTGYGELGDYATVKYDPDGNQVWVARYNGPGDGEDQAAAVAVDGSGSVYVTGRSYGSGTSQDYATIKYNQLAVNCDIHWPVCRGTRVFFSVTYTNPTGSPLNVSVTFSGYSGYDCDPANVLIQIPRNRTIPTGTTTYYYYFKVPNSVQPGEHSISVEFEHDGLSYSCCANVDVIECSPWKTGANTEWELVEADRPEVVLPTLTELCSNYPNPFNAATQFSYSLAEAGKVKLTIHNLRGQLVETVVDGHQEAGEHQVIWDASDYSSGVYFYKLQAGDYSETRRMIMVK